MAYTEYVEEHAALIARRREPQLADIGKPLREIEIRPLEEPVPEVLPVEEPATPAQPVEDPERVPA